VGPAVGRVDLFETPGPAPRRKVDRGEQRVHIACVDYLRRCVPAPPEGPYWFHPYNGGWRTKREAALGRALGVRAGVPDLVLIWRGHAIGAEFKRPKGAGSRAGRLSREQREAHAELVLAGAVCGEVRSLADFVSLLEMLGVPVRGRVTA